MKEKNRNQCQNWPIWKIGTVPLKKSYRPVHISSSTSSEVSKFLFDCTHSYSIMVPFYSAVKRKYRKGIFDISQTIHQGISSSLWQAMIVNNLTALDTLVIWYCRPVWITWFQLCLFYILMEEKFMFVKLNMEFWRKNKTKQCCSWR